MAVREIAGRAFRYIFKGVPHKNVTARISYSAPGEQLKEKKIIVTGGGHGLGYSMAKRFMTEGANVLIAGRNEDILKKSAEELGCEYLRLDVRATSTFESFFTEAENLLGGAIDCLVNNAGVSLHENSFLDVTPEGFDTQIETNFKGPFFMTQKYVERYHLHKLESGKVLFISSETSTTADERPYGLTKAAVNSLVQGLAFRYIKEGIRINAIAPGITSSDMSGYSAEGNLHINNHASERIFLPEEVAEIATFLLSDVSNTLNGQILVCNEGNTINARWK